MFVGGVWARRRRCCPSCTRCRRTCLARFRRGWQLAARARATPTPACPHARSRAQGSPPTIPPVVFLSVPSDPQPCPWPHAPRHLPGSSAPPAPPLALAASWRRLPTAGASCPRGRWRPPARSPSARRVALPVCRSLCCTGRGILGGVDWGAAGASCCCWRGASAGRGRRGRIPRHPIRPLNHRRHQRRCCASLSWWPAPRRLARPSAAATARRWARFARGARRRWWAARRRRPGPSCRRGHFVFLWSAGGLDWTAAASPPPALERALHPFPTPFLTLHLSLTLRLQTHFAPDGRKFLLQRLGFADCLPAEPEPEPAPADDDAAAAAAAQAEADAAAAAAAAEQMGGLGLEQQQAAAAAAGALLAGDGADFFDNTSPQGGWPLCLACLLLRACWRAAALTASVAGELSAGCCRCGVAAAATPGVRAARWAAGHPPIHPPPLVLPSRSGRHRLLRQPALSQPAAPGPAGLAQGRRCRRRRRQRRGRRRRAGAAGDRGRASRRGRGGAAAPAVCGQLCRGGGRGAGGALHCATLLPWSWLRALAPAARLPAARAAGSPQTAPCARAPPTLPTTHRSIRPSGTRTPW